MASAIKLPEHERPTMRVIQRGPVATGVILVVVLLLAVVTARVSIAASARRAAPELALRASPGDARALVTLAESALIEPNGLQRAAGYARQAIERDATLSTPYRILGFAADERGDLPMAERLIAGSARLSRRDLPGQLWLINRAVARDDVPGALEHFDVALRTSDKAPAILFPVLAGATAEPRVIEPLARRMTGAPWADPFLRWAIDNSPETHGLAALSLAFNKHRPLPDEVVAQLASRLSDKGAYTELRPVRAISAARLTGGDWISDPAFAKPTGVGAFEWALGQDGSAQVTRGINADGKAGMMFEAPVNRVSEIARQLLTLPAGDYRLTIDGSIDHGKANWSIVCAGPGGATLGSLPMASRPIDMMVKVPANCPAQLLTFLSVASDDGATGSVSRVSLRKQGA
ncbi:hypothetical protein SPAN111604_08595 [Sphingomonas antarctica]